MVFTAKGIPDTSKITPLATDDILGIQRTDSGFTLQQVKASRASRNVAYDKNLTWEQILIARHNLLDATSSWPTKHWTALTKFFTNLEALKATGSNSRALILYQATAHWLWHTSLKGTGCPFNLATINNSLLMKLENQIRDKDQEEIIKRTSKPCPNYRTPPHSNKDPSPSTLPLVPHLSTSLHPLHFASPADHPPPPHAMPSLPMATP